jgi:hypothetical protein
MAAEQVADDGEAVTFVPFSPAQRQKSTTLVEVGGLSGRAAVSVEDPALRDRLARVPREAALSLPRRRSS